MTSLTYAEKAKVRRRLLTILTLLIIAVLGLNIWLSSHESSSAAQNALIGQNIDISNSRFILEAWRGHEANVRHFLALGFKADTQDENNMTGLAAAAESGNQNILSAVMATLPRDNDDAFTTISQQDNLGKNALTAAVISGKENMLATLISKVAPGRLASLLDTPDRNGRTALFYAVLKDNLALLNEVLTYGADVNLTNADLETPIVMALKLGYTNLLPSLIEADKRKHGTAPSIQTADNSGATPLMYAIRENNPIVVKTLTEAGADVSASDLRGITPLMMATETGNQEIINMLIAAGAKINIADRFGNTPLTIAIRNKHIDVAKFLLAKGADVDFHTTSISPLQTAVESEPFDPDFFNTLLQASKQVSQLDPHLLFAAVTHKNTDLIKKMLEAGLSVNITNDKGETLLAAAIAVGNEDVVLMLIDKGADVRQTGIVNITPIQLATERDEIKVVQKLLDMGAAFKEKTADGYTLSEMAAYQGHPEILELLLSKGATVDLDFCVLWAIRDGHGKSVGVLLNHGANPNVLNENGETALWLASENGETEAVAALINHHALIDYPDKHQAIAPLAIASHNGHLEVVKLLTDAGAKIDVKDNYGMTALAHAAYMSKLDVVEYLFGRGASAHATDNQGRSVIDLASIAQASEARSKIIALLQKTGTN